MWGALSGLGSAIRQRLMILVLEFDRVQAVLIPVLVTVGFPLQAENDCGVLMTSLRKDSRSARAKGKLNFRVSNIAVCHLTSSSRIERPDRRGHRRFSQFPILQPPHVLRSAQTLYCRVSSFLSLLTGRRSRVSASLGARRHSTA